MRILLILTFLAAACAAPQDPDPETIMEADRAFARATAERGVDGWVEAFTEDGLQFAGASLFRGHDEIRARMAPAFTDPAVRLEWEPVEARVGGGELAYTHGRYRVVRYGEALALLETGRYLSVWRRGEDGVWRVDADIGNPDPEPDPELRAGF